MKLNMRIFPVLGAFALATIVAPYAHAGCGQYRPASFNRFSPDHFRTQFLGAQYRFASLDTDDAEENVHSIVGTWKEHWISEGTEGIPDGTEIDAGYSQWHSDHTEINLSGLRSPLTGDVCMGVWKKTGEREYRMNHFGVSFDPTGLILVGPAHIQQALILDENGKSIHGKFTIDQYDESGNRLAHLQGRILGSRVTMETGFEKVE